MNSRYGDARKDRRLSNNSNADPREAVRSNVLLSAVLSAEPGTLAVRIRNLSANGALLDGQGLPASGRVTLRRGNLSANAEVAWQSDGECGVRFDCPIDVKGWVKRVAHPGQLRVDTIIAALKAGVLPHGATQTRCSVSLPELSKQLAVATNNLAMLPNMTTELAEQILKLEVLAKSLEDHVAASEDQRDGEIASLADRVEHSAAKS